MSASGVSLEIRSDGALLAPLMAMLGRVQDKTPLMADLAAYLRDSTRRRFETQTDPDGVTWTPSLRARLQGGKTLLDHGVFRDRITDAHGPDFAAVGTNDIRARIFQFGGTIRPKSGKALAFSLPGGLGLRLVRAVTMPKRAYLGLDSFDRTELLIQARDYLLGGAA